MDELGGSVTPWIEDLVDELGGYFIYSKLDLQSDYHQMRIADDDEYKSVFKTHVRHFEYSFSHEYKSVYERELLAIVYA